MIEDEHRQNGPDHEERQYRGQIRLVERLRVGVIMRLTQGWLGLVHAGAVIHAGHPVVGRRHRHARRRSHAGAGVRSHGQLGEQQADHGNHGGNEAG